MNTLLFALGALTMIIELSVPRLIAPVYGNTMFSWTAIIAVVLSAMTIGYYFGGRITEKKKSQTYNIVLFFSTIQPESRILYLDNTIEGIIHKGIVTSYLPGITKLIDTLPEIRSALVIGGGAFAVPRYIKEKFPQAQVDVAELDGAVEKVGRKYLELTDNINILIGDGRNTLASIDMKYDLIFNDAFKGYRNMPFHLTTKEFNDMVKTKLAHNGIYAVNVRSYPTGSYLGASLFKTLGDSFEYLSLMEPNTSNSITLASSQRINFGEQFTPTGKGIMLTDNRAPIEFLVIADLVHEKISRFLGSTPNMGSPLFQQ